MLIKAFMVAYKAHKGQKDKAGKAYILHPVCVAMHTKGVKRKTVALLHDVVEDTETTINDLQQLGFNKEIVEAVQAITKKNGERYADYLKRVKANKIAKDVKLADLEHNSDLSRLKTITEKDKARKEKYGNAIWFLCN